MKVPRVRYRIELNEYDNKGKGQKQQQAGDYNEFNNLKRTTATMKKKKRGSRSGGNTKNNDDDCRSR